MTPNSSPASQGIFGFEQDFAGSLRCIPMCVRMKLDLTGIKLSLRQWSQLRPDERRELLERACVTPDEQSRYHAHLLSLIAQRCDAPPKPLPANEDHLWRDSAAIPDCVLQQAASDRVSPPTPEAWGTLTSLQRFALVKLARSRHENENFVPALREFGLLMTEPA